jgi:putative transposase
MLVFEYKLDAAPAQYTRMDEAIRSAQFVRNTCLRLWMDMSGITANDLQVNCSQLAQASPFAAQLNAQTHQAAADRAWVTISRFYVRCKVKTPGKKGSPRFQHDNRPVEYKVTGRELDPDGRHPIFTDGCGIGRVRLVGTRAIESFPRGCVKRVRLVWRVWRVWRADGYYAQFCVDAQRQVTHVSTGRQVGIDLGLQVFYADSAGNSVDNPRFLRRAERRLQQLQRQASCKYDKTRRARHVPQSHNYRKGQQKLAKAHLRVHGQREDVARKTARALVRSCDLLADEDLQIRNLVRNHRLAKSISDAARARLLLWVGYFARLRGFPLLAVPPQYTTQT